RPQITGHDEEGQGEEQQDPERHQQPVGELRAGAEAAGLVRNVAREVADAFGVLGAAAGDRGLVVTGGADVTDAGRGRGRPRDREVVPVRGRLEGDPAVVREVSLDPGVSIRLLYQVELL